MNAVGDAATILLRVQLTKLPKLLPPADPERPGNWALTIRLLPQVGQRATTLGYAQKCIF